MAVSPRGFDSAIQDQWLCVQPRLSLFDPMDCTDSSVHGVVQAGSLEWVAMPSSGGSSPPRDRTRTSWGSCVTGGLFNH